MKPVVTACERFPVGYENKLSTHKSKSNPSCGTAVSPVFTSRWLSPTKTNQLHTRCLQNNPHPTSRNWMICTPCSYNSQWHQLLPQSTLHITAVRLAIQIPVMEKGTLWQKLHSYIPSRSSICLCICVSIYTNTPTNKDNQNKCFPSPRLPPVRLHNIERRSWGKKFRLSGALGFFTADSWVRQKVNKAKFTCRRLSEYHRVIIWLYKAFRTPWNTPCS